MHDTKTMNTACLLKLAWNLETNQGTLWCQVIEGKYLRNRAPCNGWLCKNDDSLMWKALVECQSILCKGKWWNIKDGSSVDSLIMLG